MMGRGLGKTQQEILTLLRTKEGTAYRNLKKDGWHGVQTIAWMVFNGHDCFESIDFISSRVTTDSENQSFWRAVRTLEKRGLIESKILKHRGTIYDCCRKGEATKWKVIRLVQGNFSMD